MKRALAVLVAVGLAVVVGALFWQREQVKVDLSRLEERVALTQVETQESDWSRLYAAAKARTELWLATAKQPAGVSAYDREERSEFAMRSLYHLIQHSRTHRENQKARDLLRRLVVRE